MKLIVSSEIKVSTEIMSLVRFIGTLPLDSYFVPIDLKQVLKQFPQVGLIIISAERMQELNNRYRGKNKPTEVLSFEMSRRRDG